MVKIVINSEFFGMNESQSSIRRQLKEWGAGNITFSEEGYISVMMSENKFEEFMSLIKLNINKSLEELINKYNCVKSIEHNNLYTEFTVTGRDVSDLDLRKIAAEIYMSAMTYQVFNGVPQDETSISVNLIKRKDGKVVSSVTTP